MVYVIHLNGTNQMPSTLYFKKWTDFKKKVD